MSDPHELWYHAPHADSENWYGGIPTREECIEEAKGEYDDVFYVCRASNPPLRAAEWIGADELLERAEDSIFDSDRVCSEYDDGPIFECTPEQEADLVERVKRAVDEWQAAHSLTFKCRTFASMEVAERIEVAP
jgi:hypothetical protein